jgi:hypothetical protein
LALDVDAKFYGRSLVALRRMRMLRYLDVALVVLALVPVLAVGAPLLGYCFGAGGWLLQRIVAEVDQRWTRKVTTPLKQLGVTLFEGFARIWLLAGVIVIAAVAGGRRDGLTASLVIFGAYSVAFGVKLIMGPPRPRVTR